MRVNFAEGAAVAILVPIVLLLVGILSLPRTVTAILVLFGAWSLVFGVLLAISREKMYYGSWGAVLVALSPITLVPIQDTIALVLVVVILLVIVNIAMRQGHRATGNSLGGQENRTSTA